MHERRYDVLLGKVRELAPPSSRILDVGPAYEAERLRAIPGATVDTLGLGDDRFPPREGERHVSFDLKDAERPELWPTLETYDVVVFAEVLEHLPVAPLHVLRFLAQAVRESGWLVVQTPNAARLINRLRLLGGRNPFEPLREDSSSPGHIREYTLDEVLRLAEAAGLERGGWLTANYFDTGTRRNHAFRRLGPLVPRSLRAGITVWLRRPGSTLTG
jgi:SAM-dependent methyltransferase